MCERVAFNLLYQGSPVFKGYKCSSLIMVNDEDLKEITCKETVKILKSNGFEIKLLGRCAKYTRVLVFDRRALEEDVYKKERFNFLERYGYTLMPLDDLLDRLTSRMGDSCNPFPHEIGIFLGYPLKDIEGFIKNKGKNYSLSGYWKVYGDTEYASAMFSTFKKCRELSINRYNEGSSFEDILRGEEIV